MLEDSLIILYGEHEGVPAEEDYMKIFLNKDEITPLDYLEWRKIPLIYYMKNSDFGGETNSTLGDK